MAGTISFSGLSSGIDTSGWVDALVSVKQQSVTSLEQKQQEAENLLGIVNNIKSYFSSFQSCLQKITDSQFGVASMDLFLQNLAISSDTNILTASATTEAARQSYDIVVDKVATETKATSGYSQYEVKYADLNTTFGTLGGRNGTITVNQQSFSVTTDDTLGDLIEKFKSVGVEAAFDEQKSIFTINVGVNEIDDGASNLKNALKLSDKIVDGANSGSLMYVSRDTEFSKLGLTAGKVVIEGVEHTIAKNGDNYTITKSGGTSQVMNTVGDFFDYLMSGAVNAESATVDGRGNITIKGATIDAVDGGSNLLDVLNLTEVFNRTVVDSNYLSYIEVHAADLDTRLEQLGINANTTLVVGGTSNTITTDMTLRQVKSLLADGGVEFNIDNNGIITIDTKGNEISGTLLDVLGLDPSKEGTTVTSGEKTAFYQANGSTSLSDLGVNDSHKYVAYKSDGTAVTAEVSGVSANTIDQFVSSLNAAGLDAYFDNDSHKIVINDGYITGTLADVLGMRQDVDSYGQNADLNTTLEKLGATGNQTLTIDGGAVNTYNKNTTLGTVLDDIEDAGGTVIFKNGNLIIQGVTLGGTIPALLGLDATTQGSSVQSGVLNVITDTSSTGPEVDETVFHNLELSSKIGDITGTTTDYTLKVNDGTELTYTKDTTIQTLKNQIEGAGGEFRINSDNTITISGVNMSGSLVLALGFDSVDTGTRFSSVDPVMVTGTALSATGETTLGSLNASAGAGGPARAPRRAPAAGPTLSIDGGAAITYSDETSLDEIFADIEAAGGTAYIDNEGYIVIDGVHLEGTLLSKLGLIETSSRTSITSGDLKVTVHTDSTSSSVLYETTEGDIDWDSTIGSITKNTNNYNLVVNGVNTTFSTGMDLDSVKDAVEAQGGTMAINSDNTITISGVNLSGSLVDALGLEVTDLTTVITSNVPILTPGDEIEATAATKFSDLGIGTDKRDYAIYMNDGTVIRSSSTNGSSGSKTIGDWLNVLNAQFNSAYHTTGKTYAKIENGIISIIEGGYVTGSLPTALGMGTEKQVTGITMQGNSVTYVESDPLKFIGGITSGLGQSSTDVDYVGSIDTSITQGGTSAGNSTYEGGMETEETHSGDAEGTDSITGTIGTAETHEGTAIGDFNADGNIETAETHSGDVGGTDNITGTIGTATNKSGSATGNIETSGNIASSATYNTSLVAISVTEDTQLKDIYSGGTKLSAENYTLKIGDNAVQTFNKTAKISDIISYVTGLSSTDSDPTNVYNAYLSDGKFYIQTNLALSGTLVGALGLTQISTSDGSYTYIGENITYVTGAPPTVSTDGFIQDAEIHGESGGSESSELISSIVPVSGDAVFSYAPLGFIEQVVEHTPTRTVDQHIMKSSRTMSSGQTVSNALSRPGGGDLHIKKNGTYTDSYWFGGDSTISDIVGWLNSNGVNARIDEDSKLVVYSSTEFELGGKIARALFNGASVTGGCYDDEGIPGNSTNLSETVQCLGRTITYYRGFTEIDTFDASGANMHDLREFFNYMGASFTTSGNRLIFTLPYDVSLSFEGNWHFTSIDGGEYNSGSSLGGGYTYCLDFSNTFYKTQSSPVTVVDTSRVYVSSLGASSFESGKNYYIRNKADLDKLAQMVNSGADTRNVSFILENDIVLAEGTSLNVIGNSDANAFEGTFYGNGHTIKNFSIVSPSSDYVGFFGKVDGATIKDLCLENVTVQGNNNVGALAGSASGTITNCNVKNVTVSGSKSVGGLVGVTVAAVSGCYSTGEVIASGNYAGGLIGSTINSTTNKLTKSFSTANVTGNNYVGGLAGEYLKEVEDCYATGNVTGNQYVGGLLGRTSSVATRCYYAKGTVTGNTVTGRLIGEYNQLSDLRYCYADNADMAKFGNHTDWGFSHGLAVIDVTNMTTTGGFNSTNGWTSPCSENGGLPTLGMITFGLSDEGTHSGMVRSVAVVSDFVAGNVYSIRNTFDLNRLAQLVNAGKDTTDVIFVLEDDIDFGGANFTCIGGGTSSNAFKGTFYGNGHSISNFNINVSGGQVKVGLFGLTENATIRDLVINNATVSSNSTTESTAVGIMVGQANNTDLINCAVIGGSVNVTCSDDGSAGMALINVMGVGGLVGVFTGNISCCYSTADVTSDNTTVGGLVGSTGVSGAAYWGDSGTVTIERSFATGKVTGGSDNIGGFIGLFGGQYAVSGATDGNIEYIIRDSYSTGSVARTIPGSPLALTSTSHGFVGKVGSTAAIYNSYTTQYGFANDTLHGALIENCVQYSNFMTTFGSDISWLTEEDMQDPSIMQGLGFTTDKGWIYTSGNTPMLLGESSERTPVYVRDLSNFVTGETYHIANKADLDKLAELVNQGKDARNVIFVLDNDIDLAVSPTQKGTLTKIGTYEHFFSGNFYGNGHTIKNFKIESTDIDVEDGVDDESCAGLFGHVFHATIQDLCLDNIEIIGYYNVGGLVGYSENSTISNCYINSGTISATGDNVGGLIGSNSAGTISKCYSNANVMSTERNVGGLIGSFSGLIEYSYATGDVSGDYDVGGLVGDGAASTINNCYATGNVNGTSTAVQLGGVYIGVYAGGLVGYASNMTINTSYATGNVSGVRDIGGFIGYADGGTLANCVYNTQSGASDSSGATGKTLSEMQTASVMQGFGFTSANGWICNDGYTPHFDNTTVSGSGTVSHTLESSTTISDLFGDSNNHTITINKDGSSPITQTFSGSQTIGSSSTANSVLKFLNDNGIYATLDSDGKITFVSDFEFSLTGDLGTKITGTMSGPVATSVALYESSVLIKKIATQTVTDVISGGGVLESGMTYKVSTVDDLINLALAVNRGDNTHNVKFELTNNITIASGTTLNSIGKSSTNAFRGEFYGNGYYIENLTINESDSNVGLFGYVSRATIENLGIKNATVSGNGNVGILGGSVEYSTIKNCYVSGGTVHGTGNNVGGLIGIALGNASTHLTISNCYSSASVTSSGKNVGGLVGLLGYTDIEKSFSIGNVTGSDSVGGFVGVCGEGFLENCYAIGVVSSTASASSNASAGGFLGTLCSGADLTICYATGRVYSNGYKGGFIGLNGDIDDDVSLYGCIYNASTGLEAVGAGEVFDTYELTGLAYPHMKDQSVMEAAGFTSANGWSYIANMTPVISNVVSVDTDGKVYVSDISEFRAGDTYYISTKADMDQLAALVNAGKDTTGTRFILENDIDYSNTSLAVIGTGATNGQANVFRGTFYGNGHELKNFVIDSNEFKVGVFGRIENATIQDLGLNGFSVNSTNIDANVGALVAYSSQGSITNCYAKNGTVTAIGNNIGGLVGYLYSGSSMSSCYSDVTVSGDDYVGGLVGTGAGDIDKCYALGNVSGSSDIGGLIGRNRSTITNCYAKGNVSAIEEESGGFVGWNEGSISNCYSTGKATGSSNVGGFVGKARAAGSYSNCVYNTGYRNYVQNTQAAGTGSDTGITGLTILDMRDQTTMEAQGFTAANGWQYDQYLTPNLGGIDVDTSKVNGKVYVNSLEDTAILKCGDTYYLKTKADLDKLATLVNNGANTQGVVFVLENDIDCGGASLTSIGDSSHAFKGEFYGNGHEIKDFRIDSSGSDDVGLFGYIQGAIIKDLGLEQVRITGDGNVGALVGIASSSSIENCYVSGNVTGCNDVGGLVGFCNSVTISNCYSTIDVSSECYGGGLIGYVAEGSHISKSFAIGNVTGYNYVGGLTSSLNYNSSITSCYSTGVVTANATSSVIAAGFVGIANGSISNSYCTGRTYASSNAGGFIGRKGAGATLSGNVYNSSIGLSAVGTGTSVTDTQVKGLSSSDMQTQTIMESEGFTSANGWNYISGATPVIGNVSTITGSGKVYVSDISKFKAGDTYYISTKDDLVNLTHFIWEGKDTTGVTFILENDIDCGGANLGSIGDSTASFRGDFYGNGHEIKNFNLVSYDKYVGLFGNIENAVIQDVGISEFTVTGAVSNCMHVGGLVGYAQGASVITNCYTNNGTVTATSTVSGVGGLVGLLGGDATISQSYTDVTVSGDTNVGGLVGTGSGNIDKCYALGNVSGSSKVGGFIGVSNSTITNCYAKGNVSAIEEESGGFIGQNDGSILNCYSTGKATGGTNVGGFAGKTRAIGSYSNCVYNTGYGNYVQNAQAVGTGSDTGITGLSLVEMRDQSTMEANGFTAANGWQYDQYLTPNLGGIDVDTSKINGKTYVSNSLVTDFHYGDTYYISTKADLDKLATLVNNGANTQGVVFVLENDIDCIDDGALTSIGTTYANAFRGEFYGNGHEIRNFTIDSSGNNNVGFFGYALDAEIRDLGLVDADVKGNSNVGILVGNSGSSIDNCYTTGKVTATGNNIGGFAGNLDTARVNNSYSTADVVSTGNNVGGFVGAGFDIDISICFATGDSTGASEVGGFVGLLRSDSTIESSYSLGVATATASGGYVGGFAGSTDEDTVIKNSYSIGRAHGSKNGGFVGKNNDATFVGCVYNLDLEITGSSTGDITGIEGKTYVDIQNKSIMEAAGFTTDKGWRYITDGTLFTPVLGAASTTEVTGGGKVYVNGLTRFRAGDTYYLNSAEDFVRLAELVNAGQDTTGTVFVLDGDVDLSSVANFEGIGKTSSTAFKGDFYGNGYKVSNLKMNSTTDNTGLFGCLDGAVVRDLAIVDADITSSANYTGVLAGTVVGGSIINCYTTTADGKLVTGQSSVGGLVGSIDKATIESSYSSADVVGQAITGGLVGCSFFSSQGVTIIKSFATGKVVAGDRYAGGFIGVNSGANAIITDCFAKGNVVSSYKDVGGFVGYNTGNISNCYAEGIVSGSSNVGSFAGANLGTLSGNVANLDTKLDVVGDGSSSGATNLFLLEMRNGIRMKELGFTEDKGWIYNENTAPILNANANITNGGKVYLRDADELNAGDTYYLATSDDLMKLMSFVNNNELTRGVTFVLEEDINMSSVTGFASIGNSEANAFEGNFYGNGHTISGLKESLFGNTHNAMIRDLALLDVNIDNGRSAALIKGDIGGSTIDNVYATGTVKGRDTVGGLIASLGNGSTLINSYSDVDVIGKTGADIVGGLVGFSNGDISKCFSLGNVSGSSGDKGALIGELSNGSVTTCYATGDVSGNGAAFVGLFTNGTITNCYATGISNRGFVREHIGGSASGNVYNSANTDTSGLATGMSLADMQTQNKMLEKGFTSDKGWIYYTGATPDLRAGDMNSQGIKNVGLDTYLNQCCDSTVSKDLTVVVNGNTYSKNFSATDTVGDVLNWLNTISDIDVDFNTTDSKLTISADYDDLDVYGGIANMLFGGNANITLSEITVNTNSNYLMAPGDDVAITEATTIGQLLNTENNAALGYIDNNGQVQLVDFAATQTVGDVKSFLESKGYTVTLVDGVFTATKEGAVGYDILGAIGSALKGAVGTTEVTASGYMSEPLSSETQDVITGSSVLKNMGINSGKIYIQDNNGSVLGYVSIDEDNTIDEVSELLSGYGFTMSVTDGKVTVVGDNVRRLVDGTSNMVSEMKLNTWTENKDKLKLTSTVAEMGFAKGAALGVVKDGLNMPDITFSATDTLETIINRLSNYGIEGSVDTDGKFTAKGDGDFILTGELGVYLTQNSALGYEKEIDGYRSSDPLEYNHDAEELTEDTLIGELLGTGQGGILRLTLNENQVVDLQYNANDKVRDVMDDLAGYGISTNIIDGVLTALSTTDTYRFSGDIGKAISGPNPSYEDLSTGYLSDDLSYETQNDATLASILKGLGVTSGDISILSNEGRIISTLSIDDSFTLGQVRSMLTPYGIDLSVDTDGKVTVSSPDGYKLADGTSNMVSQLGLSTWITSTDNLTATTTLSEMGFKDGADLNLFLDGAVMNTLSFNANQTVQDIMFALSAYDIDASIDEGIFTAESKSHTFVMSGALGSLLTKGTTGYVTDNTGYSTYKTLEEEIPLITDTSNELTYEKEITLNTKVSDLGFKDGGNVRINFDNGTSYTLSFMGTDTIDDIVYALSAYGITADVQDGKFIAEGVNNKFTISGNLGTKLSSGGSVVNEVTGYTSASLTYETTENINNSTKLSELGVLHGNINIIKDGLFTGDTIEITDDTTIAQLFSGLRAYGMNGSIKTVGANRYIEIAANTNTTIADGTSDVVTKLGLHVIRQGDFDGNRIYWEDDATSGLLTEDTLLSTLDRNGYIAQGSLIFETGTGTDAAQHIVNISANETVGSMLQKFRDSGISAKLEDGIIKLSAGLDQINFVGGTSGLVQTINLQINNVDTYSSSSSALTYEGETSYSAANFADATTKLDIVNATEGNMSIFVDGVKCTININPNQTFKELFQQISSTVAARTGQTIQVGFLTKNGEIKIEPADAENTGIIAMSLAEGHELVVGASNDTSNFATIANLNKSGFNSVKGSRALYKVNINSLITESGLYRDGDITEGKFTIGDAEFTIDSATTLKSLMDEINKSEKSYATAYWDTLSGTMVIQSTLTGASLINIEANGDDATNFTDILGFTTKKDGVSALVTEAQTLGNNAVIRINGTSVSCASNTITSEVSKIKGLTINLKNISEGDHVTISVEQDDAAIANAVGDIVDSYNAMMEALDKELSDKNSLGNEAILKLMRNNLKRLMTNSLTGTHTYKNLAAVGITTGKPQSGSISTSVTSLVLDKDRFLEALNLDSEGVKDLLVGTASHPGIFLQINNIVEASIKTDGYFSNMTDSLKRNISKLETKINKTNDEIENYRLRLEKQFKNMELTVTHLQNSYANFLH